MSLLLPEIYYQESDLEPSKAMGRLVNSLSGGTANQLVLHDYLLVSNANHKESIDVTFRELVRCIPALLLSYNIGAIGAKPYWDYGIDAAEGDPTEEVLNPLSGIFFNTIINGYFFNLTLAPLVNWLFTSKPTDIQRALYNLRGENPAFYARALRTLRDLFPAAVIMAIAVLSAFPAYALEKKKGKDSDFFIFIVLLSTTFLQYKGVEALIYRAVPVAISPFKMLYRHCSRDAMKDHKIFRAIDILKNAYLDTLQGSLNKYLELRQIKDQERLALIHSFFEKNDSLADTTNFLFEFCRLAPTNPYSPSEKRRKALQALSLLITTASLPGLLIYTKEQAAIFMDVQDEAKAWALGFGIFFVSVALAYDVSWDVFGSIYDLIAYALNGIKTNWQESASFADFMKKAWNGKANMASWQSIFQFPLAIIQNPILLLGLMVPIFIFTYWSTKTSTFLNEVTLDPKIAASLALWTVIAVWAFNFFPIDKILGSIQQFITRIVGSAQSKQEIKLQEFIKNQIQLTKEMDSTQFLAMLNGFVEEPGIALEEKELRLQTLFGNRTSKEIFGDHKYGNRKLTEVIPSLADKNIEWLSVRGFFGSNRATMRERQPFGHESRMKLVNMNRGVNP